MPDASAAPQVDNRDTPAMLIGVHHKTGSVWMMQIFAALAEKLNRKLFRAIEGPVPTDTDMYFHRDSNFCSDYLESLANLPRPWRGIHLIRDPRDVIVSGCFYHQKSQETWLHLQSDDFGGRTYQQAINDLETEEQRLRFEMEQLGRIITLRMAEWDYAQPNFMELRYEDLIVDHDLELFTRMFKHMGLHGDELATALEITYENSIFGGRKDAIGTILHLRSGQPAQWPQHFTPALTARFKEMFPGVLAKLGYERDDNWDVQ